MQEFVDLFWWPALYAVGLGVSLGKFRDYWFLARGVSLVSFVGMLAVMLVAVIFSNLRIDYLALLMSLLVSLLGWVVVEFSAKYLNGEPKQERFIRAMLITLISVSLLVVSRHLVVIVLAWVGTSAGMHYLLTYYHDRKSAQVAAHKKFIVSRMADVCLFGALALIYHVSGSFTLDDLVSYLATLDTLPVGLHIAAFLFALGAILKSAQLPVHGWLIQVMEAPTPVSALLHAGVVNIGGFVLIRLADLLALAPAAQILLVVMGSLTTVLASLVMMTRISIKVRLAWSTCAQMGFMLMEIGLGLYELALLHLLAHSCYKAYAFLSAGSTVDATRLQDFAPPSGRVRSLIWYLFAPFLTLVLIGFTFFVWQWWLPGMNIPIATLLILALGLTPLLWFDLGISKGLFVSGGLRVLALTQLYLIWHTLFTEIAPPVGPVVSALLFWAVLAILLLYILQIWLRIYPSGSLASRLYPWVYSGFYLDETFTRMTFRVWPVRLSSMQAKTMVNRHIN